MANIEVCSGFQESEEDWEEFIKNNPDFPHSNPLEMES